MGTRSGDVDPAIPFYIMRQTGKSMDEVERILNKKSGVLGITGKWVDRRDIELAAEDGNERAQLAIEIEAYRLKKYIGSYAAALGSIDAIVFTAGVGERGPITREYATNGLEKFGIAVDKEKNWTSMTRNAETEISADDSEVKVFVIPTDEELVMTEDTYALMEGAYDIHTNFTYSFQHKDYVNKGRAQALKKDLQKRPGIENIIAKPK
jgi:acetate kinase